MIPLGNRKRGQTIAELLATVLLVGVVAALGAPRLAGASVDTRSSKMEDTLAEVRSAIGAYRARADREGLAPFPMLEQLSAPGAVAGLVLPANSLTGVRGVQPVTRDQARRRAVLNEGRFGWNYFVDNLANPPEAVFYANCRGRTTAPAPGPGTLSANEL